MVVVVQRGESFYSNKTKLHDRYGQLKRLL